MGRTATYGQIILVRPESKLNLSWTIALISSLVCLFFALAFKVAIQLQCTDLAYEIANENKVQMALQMESQELDLQLSVAKRMDVLAEQAKKLGLVELSSSQIKLVN